MQYLPIQMGEVTLANENVRMIVSFHEPYCIYATEMQSGAFLGRTENELHGLSVLDLCGPFTDTELLISAISDAAVWKCNSIIIMFNDTHANQFECFLSSAPYVDDIGHLNGCLLSFSYVPLPQPTPIRSGIGVVAQPMTLGAGAPHPSMATDGIGFFKTAGAGASASASASEPNSPDSHSSPYASESDPPDLAAAAGGGVRVFPRRKRGHCSATPQPAVTVSLDAVRALQDLPAHEAAARLGISTTALKRACRKLGVERWAYRRVPGPPTDDPPAHPPAADGPRTPGEREKR